VGSILGSYLSGIVLIPILGSATTIRIATLALVASLVATIICVQKARVIKIAYAGLALAVATLAMSLQTIDFKNIIKSAYYQYADEKLTFSEVMRYFSRDFEEFKLIS